MGPQLPEGDTPVGNSPPPAPSVWNEDNLGPLHSLTEGKFVKLVDGVRRNFELVDLRREFSDKPEFGDDEGKVFVFDLIDKETGNPKQWKTTSKRALASLKAAEIDRGSTFEITRHGTGVGTTYEILDTTIHRAAETKDADLPPF